MIAYALRRLVWAVLLILIMTWASFILFFVIPPDQVSVGRGQETTQVTVSEAMGIDRGPLPVQWAEYVWNAVRHQSLVPEFPSVPPWSKTTAGPSSPLVT